MKNEFDYLNDVKVDFSLYDEESVTKKELDIMKNRTNKRISWKKCGIIAVCVSAVAVIGVSSYAAGFIGKVLKILSTGNNEFYQVDDTGMSVKIPKKYDGYFYDKEGSKVEVFVQGETYYDPEGNVIEDMEKYVLEKGEGSAKPEDPLVDMAKSYNIVRNIDELEKKPGFTVKIPEYIPEGFSFHGGAYAGDEGEYLFLYYMREDGEYIMIHERLMNEETAYAMGGREIYETEINGNKAVVIDKTDIAWEEDGISVDIAGRNLLKEDELIAMAKSIN